MCLQTEVSLRLPIRILHIALLRNLESQDFELGINTFDFAKMRNVIQISMLINCIYI